MLSCFAPPISAAGPAAAGVKRDVLSGSEVRGGLVVHLGCSSAALLAEFASDRRFVAHGLARRADRVAAVRTALASRGLYGRGSAELLTGAKLPYVDQLVRFLVVEEPLGIEEAEMLRVLCPRGVLYRRTPKGWRRTVKPWPATLDEWTHARHGADGNVVSRDRLVGPPTNVRWISGRQGSRRGVVNTQVIVSSGGRLFAVTGERDLSLVARDAFSGVILWARPYPYKLPPPALSHVLAAGAADRRGASGLHRGQGARRRHGQRGLLLRRRPEGLRRRRIDHLADSSAGCQDRQGTLASRGGGKKKWQKETPHRDLTNALTGGAYEFRTRPYSVTPDPRPAAAAPGGWLVRDGPAVQIDRLGAFDVNSGRAAAMFDDRLRSKYVGPLRPLKNRSRRPHFDQWLLAADDGKLILIDKATTRVRAERRFPGLPVPHGLAVANGRVFITTKAGRLLCIGPQR